MVLGFAFGTSMTYQAVANGAAGGSSSADSRFFIFRYLQKYSEYCDEEPSGANGKWVHHMACEKSTEVVIAVFTAVLALFTSALVGVGYFQWRVTRDAMIAGERAFVFAIDILPMWAPDPQFFGLYTWVFRPTWKNSGETPTRSFIFRTACALMDADPPPGFVFTLPPNSMAGRGLLPPGQVMHGSAAPRPPDPQITAANLIDVQSGKRVLYMWGSAEYFDVFSKRPRHITKFCWKVAVLGDPLSYDPQAKRGEPGSLSFQTSHHIEGNCADEECEESATR